MNVRDLFPLMAGPLWPFLEDGAKADWLRVTEDSTGRTVFWPVLDGLPVKAAGVLAAALSGKFKADGANNAGAYIYAVTRVIAEGPKVFRATTEQCLSLEHVSINLPIIDYRQPYPTMVVEFPAEYRKDVDNRTGGTPACPRHVVVKHWTDGNAVLTGCQIVDRGGLPAELVYMFGSKAKDGGVIEDVLGVYHNADKAESALLEAVTRVSLNLMLLLSHAGSRLVPSNPDEMSRYRAKLKKGVRPDLQRRGIGQHVHLVIPDRVVVVRDSRSVGIDSGTHASPIAHWRRGHWRAAPNFGEARGRGETVPLVFVRPCLVHGRGGQPAAPCYSVPGGAS